VSGLIDGLRRIALWPLSAQPGGGPADVIVVLGAALTADGRLGATLAERVAAGVRAYRDGAAPLVIMTGAREAGAMRAEAIAGGVPASAILLENTAATTRENAVASARLMRRHRLERALVVTHRFHSRRSMSAFRRVGVDAVVAVMPVGCGDSFSHIAREYLALAVYAARGWLRW
jgi:uncharacterized SAM-binding protein YcdF (DUF218 family)